MPVAVPNALALGLIADGSLMVASDVRNDFAATQVGVNGLIAMFTVAPTKGDLIVSRGGGSFDRLAVGADGQSLVADSTQPLGVKYAAAGATQPTAHAYKSAAAQAITTSTWTSLVLDGELFDTDTMHDTVTNNSRLTCHSAGEFIVAAGVGWVAADAGTSFRRMIRLLVNGAIAVAYDSKGGLPDTVDDVYMNVSTIVSLAVNDYVEVQAWHNKGSNSSIDTGAPVTHLSAARVSA